MQNVCDTQLFLVGNGVVIFTVECFEGMVGEAISTHRAVYVGDPLSKLSVAPKRELSYEDLRSLYRVEFKQRSKTERVQFWRWMRSMSPEQEKLRLDEMYADARARVV